MIYLCLLMAVPLHADNKCDHELDQIESNENGHSDNHCCPPFSSCNICSVFTFQLPTFYIQKELWLKPAHKPCYIELEYSNLKNAIWEPPQLF